MKKLHILTLSMMLSAGFMVQSNDADMSDVDAMPTQEESASGKTARSNKQKKGYQDPASRPSKNKKNIKKKMKQVMDKYKLRDDKAKTVKADTSMTNNDHAVIQGRYY